MSADPRLRSTDELTLVGTIVTAHRAPFRGVVTVRDGVIAAVSDQPGMVSPVTRSTSGTVSSCRVSWTFTCIPPLWARRASLERRPLQQLAA